MGEARRSVDAYYARGMLEIRTTLHLSVRLGVRTIQVFIASGAAAEGTGLWRPAIVPFVVLDVLIWLALRRSHRFGLAWRLPLDALDAAFWVLSPLPPSGTYDWAVFIAVPLAVEAGVRVGWRALLVPAVVFLSTSGSAVLAGKPVGVTGLFWLVLSVALGVGFFRYCRHLDARAETERRRALVAARRRAHLAGQNHVAMGASSAVDAIEGLVPVLGRPERGSALWRLADGWKTQLSASTTQEARYLQVALLEWERRHNHHPDLSGLVEVHVEEGAGTTLLTADQASMIGAALDRLVLRGVVPVRLRDPEMTRIPGQALRLVVAGRSIVVPADPRAAPPPFDPCPIAYSYIAAITVVNMGPAGGYVSAPAGLAAIASCVVAATVSHRCLVRYGQRARLAVFGLAVLVSTALTALNGFARSPVSGDDEPVWGFGVGVLLLSFLGGFYWTSLGRWRWAVPVAMAGNVWLWALLFPAPELLTPRILVAAVLWNNFPFLPFRHLARALDRVSEKHSEATRTDDEGAVRAAFVDGQESVVGLVRQAREDALRQLRALQPRLDPDIAALAYNRLEEVRRRLQTIESERVSSSSTTTS